MTRVFAGVTSVFMSYGRSTRGRSIQKQEWNSGRRAMVEIEHSTEALEAVDWSIEFASCGDGL